MESSGRIEPLKESKGVKGLYLEVGKRRHKFARRWTSSVEEHLVIRRNRQGRKDSWNSRGEFMHFRELSDLIEEQGRYGAIF
jgi:hypothetical protein